jgi:hypothetical protein
LAFRGIAEALALRLAKSGCSANEIAAIMNHATLAEVSGYTMVAEKK